jgi:hypothetical protein
VEIVSSVSAQRGAPIYLRENPGQTEGRSISLFMDSQTLYDRRQVPVQIGYHTP